MIFSKLIKETETTLKCESLLHKKSPDITTRASSYIVFFTLQPIQLAQLKITVHKSTKPQS